MGRPQKLSTEQKKEIREKHASGTVGKKVLSEQYSVCLATIIKVLKETSETQPV